MDGWMDGCMNGWMYGWMESWEDVEFDAQHVRRHRVSEITISFLKSAFELPHIAYTGGD